MAKITKTNEDKLVTQEVLKSELNTLRKEIKSTFDEERQKNMAFFASKQDLKDGLDNLKQDLKTDINKNQIYLEKIVAKLETKEQENIMHGHQHKVAEDRLADHDKRLEKLEKSTSFAH